MPVLRHSPVAGRLAGLIIATLVSGAPALAAGASGQDYVDGQPGLADALKRDLGLTDEQLAVRIDAERLAVYQETLLQDVLGADFAGAWIDQDSLKLVVAVTSPAAARTVASVGAQPVVHRFSLAELEQAQQSIDQALAQPHGAAIAATHLDIKGNAVVVDVLDDGAGLRSWIHEAAGGAPELVRVVKVEHRPEPLQTLYGGNAFHKGAGPHCSVGFAVSQGGFLTAGHCGSVNEPVTLPGVGQFGVFAASTFPGADMAWVQMKVGSAQPWTETYTGAQIPVLGSTSAPIGASVCRSGFSTGYQCGVVQGFNSTVNYDAGAVYGLTRTNACAWFGDSGGPFISASGHGQGVTSGGVLVFCDVYFQPLLPILAAYNVSLNLGSGAMPAGSAPSISHLQCPDMTQSGAGQFVCHVNYSASGPTSVSWFVDGWFMGDAFTDTTLYSTCALHTPVQVQVRVANLHGSAISQRYFGCPSDLIP